ncbi:MAG: ATP-binding protein [Vicinamibacteria bacterium]|nr:ATP-binding protein [Vicinamibacteria bacterium]
MKNRLPAVRDVTNESLRDERKKTDLALAERQDAVEAEADDVVKRARETADAVLETAREKADEARQATPAEAPPPVVAAERAVEDATLEDERAAADASVHLEREKSERALRDDFLNVVSHDLRNLLGGIVMSAALVAEWAGRRGEASPDSGILAETSRIQRFAARMNRLIGDLLDVGSIEAGKLAVVATPGDMGALVAEAVDACDALARSSGLTLETELGDDLAGEYDHDRMIQVLANLITNAIKFTPRGGTVRVRATHAAEGVRVCVEDTGAGIPAGMLEAVFQRFWQVSPTDQRGLGLYISRCIVVAHGGRIWAESTPGEGSRLFFVVPTRRSPV